MPIVSHFYSTLELVKKLYIIVVVLILAFLALGYYTGWLDNGPRTIQSISK